MPGALDISGFKEAKFDKKMLDTLVIDPRTKGVIQRLTGNSLKGLEADASRERSIEEQQLPIDIEPAEPVAWSADFVEGKGQGLVFLLHGKPGVGKTYTAGEWALTTAIKAST